MTAEQQRHTVEHRGWAASASPSAALESYFDTSREAAIILDMSGTVMYANQRALDIVGYEAPELVGQNMAGLPIFKPQSLQRARELFSRNVTGQSIGPEIMELVRKDGSPAWIALFGNVVATSAENIITVTMFDVTVPKQTEDAVTEERNRSRQYLDIAGTILLVLDAAGRVCMVNRKGCEVFGLPEEEILGQDWFAVFLPVHTRRKTRDLFRRLLTGRQGPEETAFENPIITSQGEERLIAWHNAVVRDEQGVITGTLSSGEDITARREMEKTLQEAKEFNATLLDNAPNQVVVFNPDMSIAYVNPSWEKLNGWTSEEVVGLKPPYPWWPPDQGEALTEVFKQTIEGGPGSGEIVSFKKNGEQYWIAMNWTPVKQKGRLSYFIVNSVDITERKHAEEALQESEERYRTFISSSNDGIIAVDGTMQITLWNKAAEAILGYTEAETIGQSIMKVVPNRYRRAMRRAFRRFTETGESTSGGKVLEVAATRKDGTEVPVELSISSAVRASEPVFTAILRDVTKRKQAEAALQESEELFAKAFNASPDAVCITSVADGTYREVNNGFTELIGYTREEAVGRTSQELGVWAHADNRERMVRLLKERGRLRNEEFEFLTKSGEIRTCLLSAERINVGGQECIISSSFDITERKQAQNLLKTLANSSPIGVYIAQDGVFKHVNRHLVQTLNYPLDKLIGAKTSKFVLPRDLRMARNNAIAMLKGERSHPYAYRVIDRAGETRYVMETVTSIMYQGKRAVLGNLMDVTQLETMETELRQHRDHLEELVSQRTRQLTEVNRRLEEELVNRQQAEAALVKAKEAAEVANQAKSEFLAHMSHEIRTPIHGMIGMINLAIDCSQDAERRQYLGMALTSADVLQGVINDILDLSKIEAGQLDMLHEDFDLMTVVEDAAEALATVAFKKGLELTAHVAPDVPTALNGDPGHLRQVITNLLGNAIKFTMQGEVVLRVEKVNHSKKTTKLLFSVRDTGIGIPPDKMGVIFRPFSQADGSINRQYGGTGLGLAISQHLVRNMKGHIWVESEPEHGSTFHFTASFAKAAPQGMPAPPEFLGRSALIVEGNAASREILGDLLGRTGFTCAAAANVREAARMLRKKPGSRCDLFLVDRWLPDQDGLEAAGQLRELAPEAAAIILIPPDNISVEYDRCQEAGFRNYLVKPVRSSRLAEVVRKAFRKEPADRDPALAPPPASDGPRLRVLVVEDNATSQIVARKMLEKMGHTVSVAGNGLEATKLAAAEAFDFILMDAEMPIMNGLEATRRIRADETGTGRHIPIIAMTAYAMKADRDRCLEAGMDAYLSKPARPNDISALIQSFVGSRECSADAPAVDIDEAMRIFDGDTEMMREAAGIFIEQDYPEQLAVIRDGIARGDAEAVRSGAHSLKGAARSLGGRVLGDLAFKLEEAGRRGDLNGAETIIAEMEKEAVRLADYFTAAAGT